MPSVQTWIDSPRPLVAIAGYLRFLLSSGAGTRGMGLTAMGVSEPKTTRPRVSHPPMMPAFVRVMAAVLIGHADVGQGSTFTPVNVLPMSLELNRYMSRCDAVSAAR